MGFLFGMPLVAQEIFGIVLDSGDRALVRYYLGADALGFYSVAYGLATYVNTFIMSPLGLAILPIYMRLWTSEGREKTIEFLSFTLDLYLMAAIGILAVVVVSSRDAVLFLASTKYHGADRLIPTVVAGLLIYTVQVFLNAGLIIDKKTGSMAMALAYSAVINIGMNCLLLPRMGLQAAALATLVSYAFCTLLLARMSFKVLPLDIQFRVIVRYLFAAAVASAAGSRVDFGIPVWNLIGKSALAVLLYAGVLSLVDRRVRDWTAQLWRRLKQRAMIDSELTA